MHALFLAFALAAPPDKAPATLDEKIAAALKTHPDIKAAEAKKLLAEAELEQARLVITQKVSAAVSKVELAKAKLMQAEEEVAIAEKVFQMGTAMSGLEKAQFMKAKPVLIGAKAELAAAELELQQLIGPAVKADVGRVDPPPVKLPTGPAMQKLEDAVRMTVKLNFKDVDRVKAIGGLLTAVRVEPETVRGMKLLAASNTVPAKLDLVGEQTFAGWVQLFLDEYNGQNLEKLKLGVYVREYGLLIEYVENAPKDAMTLTEFSRAVRAKQK